MTAPVSGLFRRRTDLPTNSTTCRARDRRRRPVLEGLEPRALLSTTLTELPLAASVIQSDIVEGPGGNMYFVSNGNIAEVTPDGAPVATFRLPGQSGVTPTQNGPIALCLTAVPGDGQYLWIGTAGASASGQGTGVYRLDTYSGSFTEYPTSDLVVSAITHGPDGHIWFVEPQGKIGEIDPAAAPGAGNPTEYTTPDSTPGSAPDSITAGPNGTILYTDNNANLVVQVDPATGNVVNQIPLVAPDAIVADPDNGSQAFWFTSADHLGNVYRYDLGAGPSTNPLTAYPVPNAATASPIGITVGSDKAIWFTDDLNNTIDRLDRATGAVTTYPTTGSLASGNLPFLIGSGSDGTVWFTEMGKEHPAANLIGKIDTAGQAASTDVSLAVAVSSPTVQMGDTFHYTLTLTNNGPSDATNVVVTLQLPSNVGYTGVNFTDGYVYNSQTNTVTYTLNTLAAGTSSPAVPVPVYATALGTQPVPPAIIVSHTPDPNPGNNVVPVPPVTVAPATADLAITGQSSPTSVHVGGVLTYQLSLANAGPALASNVTVVMPLPANTTFDAADSTSGVSSDGVNLTYFLSSLPVTATPLPVTFAVIPTAAGTVAATSATISTGPEDVPDPNQENNTVALPAVPVASAPPADLTVSIKTSASSFAVGTQVAYTVTITNVGQGTAQDVKFTTAKSTGLQYVSSTEPLNAPFTALAPGASTTFVVTEQTTRPSSQGPVTLEVDATCGAPQANAQTDGVSKLTVNVPDSSNVFVAMAQSPNLLSVGGEITYAVTVTNRGGALKGFALNVQLPPGIVFESGKATYAPPKKGGPAFMVAASTPNASGQVVQFKLGSNPKAPLVLPANSLLVFNITARAKQQAWQSAPGNGPPLFSVTTNVKVTGAGLQKLGSISTSLIGSGWGGGVDAFDGELYFDIFHHAPTLLELSNLGASLVKMDSKRLKQDNNSRVKLVADIKANQATIAADEQAIALTIAGSKPPPNLAKLVAAAHADRVKADKADIDAIAANDANP